MTLSHLDDQGAARMVDIAAKQVTLRTAIATAKVRMNNDAWQAMLEATAQKGDVLATARIAGIMAAKNTAQLIPLCHPLSLEKISIDFDTNDSGCLGITATASLSGKTGVEMEALTAASITALTVYDMLKAVDKSMIIEQVRLRRKTGGKSGDFQSGDFHAA